jgi:hypothetical protein
MMMRFNTEEYLDADTCYLGRCALLTLVKNMTTIRGAVFRSCAIVDVGRVSASNAAALLGLSHSSRGSN